MSYKFKIVLACISLFSLSFGLYFQTSKYEFLNFDDYDYVHHNSMVVQGLNFETLNYAFSLQHVKDTACWHPVTAITYLINVSLHGVNSGAMHLFNAAVHSVNGVWLFLFLLLLLNKKAQDCTGTAGNVGCASRDRLFNAHLIAAMAGALFWTLHPLRVEAVAWVASRKDVMCMFFMLPGLTAHLYGKRRNSEKFIILSTVCFLLAFLSKPSSVVYPLLAVMLELVETRKIIWRKNLGFLYLMVIMMFWTVFVQDAGGGMDGYNPALHTRILNAFSGIWQYALTTVFPHNLHPLYKYEIPLVTHRVVLGIMFAALCLCLFVIKLPLLKKVYSADSDNGAEPLNVKDHLSILILLGVMWFFVALIPVSGIVKFGFTSCADRFTYLPGIGFSIIAACLMYRFAIRRQAKPLLYCVIAVCLLYLAGLSVKTWHQTRYWKDELTLLKHATQADKEHYYAYAHIGLYYLHAGDLPQSLPALAASAKIECFLENYGTVLFIENRSLLHVLSVVFSALEGEPLDVKRFDNKKAVHSIQTSRIYTADVSDDDPLAAPKLLSQGLCAYADGLDISAKEYLSRVLKLAPEDNMAWAIYGFILERLGDKAGAIDAYNKSLKLEYDRRLVKRLENIK